VSETTGAYELTLGNPVVEVTGIRKDGGRGFVDFRWHFDSVNDVGRSLPGVANQREQQRSDDYLSAAEKSLAPFWIGSAEFASYDDGWRVEKINLCSGKLSDFHWEYGPDWPDPSFKLGGIRRKPKPLLKREYNKPDCPRQNFQWTPCKAT